MPKTLSMVSQCCKVEPELKSRQAGLQYLCTGRTQKVPVTAVSDHKQFLKVLIKTLVDIYSYFQIKYTSSLNCKIKLFQGQGEPPSLPVNHLKLRKLKRNRFSTYQHVIQYYFILLKKNLSGLPKEFHTYRLTFSSNTENHYQPRPAVKQRGGKGKNRKTLIFQKGFESNTARKHYPA